MVPCGPIHHSPCIFQCMSVWPRSSRLHYPRLALRRSDGRTVGRSDDKHWDWTEFFFFLSDRGSRARGDDNEKRKLKNELGPGTGKGVVGVLGFPNTRTSTLSPRAPPTDRFSFSFSNASVLRSSSCPGNAFPLFIFIRGERLCAMEVGDGNVTVVRCRSWGVLEYPTTKKKKGVLWCPLFPGDKPS
ncbi:hypothetical protein BDW22DRAFT_604310 [Trametopsis cervina]|nr:hypothetical protein BDW22DRAFT_604310 [Trametopsis cervina]